MLADCLPGTRDRTQHTSDLQASSYYQAVSKGGLYKYIREAAKNGIFLVARPLRPYPPPPSSLVATKKTQEFF